MTWTNPGTQSTGYLVTAEDWNALVNDFLHLNSTRCLTLDIGEAHPPLSVNPMAAVEQVESNAGTPKCSWLQARFDAGTTEALQWSKGIPDDYGGSASIKFQGYMATATGGTVVMLGAISAQSAADVTGTTRTFGTVTAATVIVPGTACQLFAGTITLADTNGLVTGDHAVFYLERQGTATADNAGGDLVINKVTFDYGL